MPSDNPNPVCNGSLACKVTAHNLSDAVVERLGVSVSFIEGEAFPIAKKLIEEIAIQE
jgi:hypothetical protein